MQTNILFKTKVFVEIRDGLAIIRDRWRLNLLLEKVIDRPTQTPLCGFAAAAREPLKFCSDEHVFERFSFFV